MPGGVRRDAGASLSRSPKSGSKRHWGRFCSARRAFYGEEGAQRAALPVFRPDNPDPFSFSRYSSAFSGLPQSWYSLTIPSPAGANSSFPSVLSSK
jgi:hypothetical protein